MTFSCLLAAVVAALLLPLLFLIWLSETPQQRARRWRTDGATYRVISERLGVSQTTARRWCMA